VAVGDSLPLSRYESYDGRKVFFSPCASLRFVFSLTFFTVF